MSYRISVTIDASECSICNQSGCSPMVSSLGGSAQQYWIGAGKPYWHGDFYYPNIPASNSIDVQPIAYPRYPNQNPPNQCDCIIRL